MQLPICGLTWRIDRDSVCHAHRVGARPQVTSDHPAAESYRADGKVKKRTIANLTNWPEPLVEGLRTLLRGGVALATADEALTISRSLPHGHVAAVLGTAEQVGLPKLLSERRGGSASRRYRDLSAGAHRQPGVAPASKLATVRALNPQTAASSLGERLGLGEVAEREVYAALDWLLDQQERIENALAKRHRSAAPWPSTTSAPPAGRDRAGSRPLQTGSRAPARAVARYGRGLEVGAVLDKHKMGRPPVATSDAGSFDPTHPSGRAFPP